MDEKQREKILRAAALKYDVHKDQSPRVAAKGMRHIAEQILTLARQHNIPVREDADLLELLMKIEVGDEIPQELYQVVAEMLAFVYRTNKKWKTIVD